MKQGHAAQVKSLKAQKNRLGKQKQATQLKPFVADKYIYFLRVRWYLTHHQKLSKLELAVSDEFLLSFTEVLLVDYKTQLTAGPTTINVLDVLTKTLNSSVEFTWQYFTVLNKFLGDFINFFKKESSVNPRTLLMAVPKRDEIVRLMANNLGLQLSMRQGQEDKLAAQYAGMFYADGKLAEELIAEMFRGTQGMQPKLIKTPLVALGDDMEVGTLMVAEYTEKPEVAAFLQAVQTGMIREYHQSMDDWNVEGILSFVQEKLFDYWTPQADVIVGLGNELGDYVKYLAEAGYKLPVANENLNWTALDEYISDIALNWLLINN
ncbi:hypothetical protein EQG49_03150 [Periweissella cryptocerci]|uniref:Uncharacterized protein n=1 Tax=Periweissella cryptocerci TaxID=2506420 RepID=A0A4P6YSC4_9LACO|nr:hypothetical protein [Periweissella cryptocerci]QBO35522.1 hypothetical protein EQG49_03150 [Periweissella cryptocerci]